MSVTNTIGTLVGFQRRSPPPWEAGNRLSFRFRKAPVPGRVEEWAEWDVVNIHAENFAEITRRLKMSSVEVRVAHTGLISSKVLEAGRAERETTIDRGYAVVTDSRIPRAWFLAEPSLIGGRGREKVDPALAHLKATYPHGFRASD